METITTAVGSDMLKSDEVELLYTSRNKANGENGGDEDSELETTTLVRES
jgi:hypothetical protein